ncbi:MAG: ImmA/IrrE family metallo-endopeptidase [Candidatus Puniceispirillaceae bacterium]
MDYAYIKPSMLSWARKRCGFNQAVIAEKLKVKVDKVKAWEAGDEHPAMGRAKDFAKKTYIPFGYLYLNEPPEIKMPVADFRSGIGKKTSVGEVNLYDFIQDVVYKKEWYEEYLSDVGTNYRSSHFQGKYSLNDSTNSIAENIRDFIGLGVPPYNNRRGSTSAFWTDIWKLCENAGLWVMRTGYVGSNTYRRIPQSTCRGMALKSDFLPIIWVNTQSDSARSFTIMHELAHIFLGEEGVSNFDQEDAYQKYQKLERKCDEIAAEVLVPMGSFVDAWNRHQNIEENLSALQRVYAVSKFVLLRRAYETEIISKQQFDDEYEILKSDVVPSRGAGGDSNRNLIAKNGRSFVQAVLAQLREGNVHYPEALNLLNVGKYSVLDSLYEKLESGEI